MTLLCCRAVGRGHRLAPTVAEQRRFDEDVLVLLSCRRVHIRKIAAPRSRSRCRLIAGLPAVRRGLQLRHAMRSLKSTKSAAGGREGVLPAQTSTRLRAPSLRLAVGAFHHGAGDKSTMAFRR